MASIYPLEMTPIFTIALSEDETKRTGVPVAPPLWFGWSSHHLAYPGSVSIRPEVLVELMYDVISSLSRHDFSRFIVINGHRVAKIPWLQLMAEKAQRELGVRVVVFDPAYMSREIADELGFGPLGHADEIETSHMLYRHPELVRMERVRGSHPRE